MRLGTSTVAFFAGFTPAGSAPYGRGEPRTDRLMPVAGATVWAGADRLYRAGGWPAARCVAVDLGPVRAALFGDCLAEPATVAAALARIADRGDHDHSPLLRLPGSFNLVIRDGDALYAYASRLRPIYFARHRAEIAFSSRALALRQLTGAPVDPERLAASLSLRPIMAGPPLFTGVEVAPAGTRLVVPADGVPRVSRCAPPPPGGLGAAGLRAALSVAVRGRLAGVGTVTTDLAGGFGDTTVSLLGADGLVERAREMTSVTGAGDPVAARRAAATRLNIDHVVLPDDVFPLPYARFDDGPPVAVTDEPVDCAGLLAEQRIVFDLVASLRSGAHLVGLGAAALRGAGPGYLADLVRRLRPVTFTRHGVAWARAYGRPPWPVLRDAMSLGTTPYAAWARDRADELIDHRPSASSAWSGGPWPAPWLTGDARAAAARALRASGPLGRPGEHAVLTAVVREARRARQLADIASGSGVCLHAPWLDDQVVYALLDVAARERAVPARHEADLAGAFADIGPPGADPGPAAAEERLLDGLRLHGAAVRSRMRDSRLAAAGLLDPEALDAAIAAPDTAGDALHHTLATELWLAGVDAAPAMWDPGPRDGVALQARPMPTRHPTPA